MKIVHLMGAPGSPYTRKMLALMRYRHIDYQVHWQSFNSTGTPDGTLDGKAWPRPKVALLPTYYLPDAQGEIEAVTDTSPILRRFEKTHTARTVIPPDAVLGFLNWLIEDYADEWLTKAMFHYRWHYAADIEKAGSILPRWHKLTASDDEIAPLSEMISQRQISRLSYVGSNEVTKQTIEDGFARFLALFDRHLQNTRFMFGARPASADFAIYGQLTQLALFDPTPRDLITAQFPRIYAWTEVMEDLSGLQVADDDWLAGDALPDSLGNLLQEIGALYLPYLLANAEAVTRAAEQMQTELDGRAWTQNPFPYQAKCLLWLREQYATLSANDKKRLASMQHTTDIIAQLET